MRAFRFEAFTGIDGGELLANCGTRIATERDMEWFWRRAEPDLDRLTLELCAEERRLGNVLPGWLLEAELAAFKRQRKRAA